MSSAKAGPGSLVHSNIIVIEISVMYTLYLLSTHNALMAFDVCNIGD